MKKQFLFFLFCLCAGVSNVWAQETDWSPLVRVSKHINLNIENDETYPWQLADGILTNTNKGVSNSTSTFKMSFTCEALTVVQWNYSVKSEQNYDKLTIRHNDRVLGTYSGARSESERIRLHAERRNARTA